MRPGLFQRRADRRLGFTCGRVGRARIHPLLEVGDGLLGELGFLGGHRQSIVVPDGVDQEALAALAGNDRGTSVAAFGH